MKVAIAGGTGLVGTALVQHLSQTGHTCLILSRQSGDGHIVWNPAKGVLDAAALEGVDAVVNLAGRNVGQRWSTALKREIRDSRVDGTRLIAEAMAQLNPRPQTLINASAIGYYGAQRQEALGESAAAGKGFLAEVTEAWEESTMAAEAAGIRVVKLRIGVVLSPAGGALAKMLPAFRAGLGGPLGDGQAVLSWIALDDLVRLIVFALEEPRVAGPVNAVAPNAVANAEFTRVLGDVLNRPAVIPAPAFALKLAFGEMANETLLSSLHVVPEKAQAAGFTFDFPDLKPALEHLLS
ncbi:MAG: TIGR01777 family oxidoreductase [Verrucomicrobiota bacterium]